MTEHVTIDGVPPRRPRAAPATGWRSRCRRLAAGLLVASGLSAAATAASAETRTLSLYFSHTSESISVVYKRDGRYDPAGLRELNRFLRDWRRNESTQMAPELFDLIWDVQQEFGGKTISVVSAYRSPATNAMLRSRSRGVAKHSQHMEGHAMDFFIKGVDLKKLRYAGVRRQVGGVGFYPNSGSPFVHMDVGSVRAWPRLSRSELARLFPDGKTLHVPASGGPLPGYAEAQALEKQGKLARLDRRGGGTIGGGGGGGLFAMFSGGGRRGAADGDQRVVATSKATPRSRTARPERDDDAPVVAVAAARPAPAKPAAAKPAPASPADAEVRTASVGAFRPLPSVSLGALIGRNEDTPADAPEVAPVALPATPLAAVAVERAAPSPVPAEAPAAAAAAQAEPDDASPAEALPDSVAAFVPVPRAAPRIGAAPAAAPGADPVGEILVAAATPAALAVPARRPDRALGAAAPRSGIDALLPAAVAATDPAAAVDAADASVADVVEDTALDVAAADAAAADAGTADSAVPRTDTLAFADPSAAVAPDASPLSATAAYVPRSALAPLPAPVPSLAPRPAAAATGPSETVPSVDSATLDAMIAPVVGATPELIANTSDVASGSFASLTRPNRNVAARDGVLMAHGFLGAPSGFSDGDDIWLDTERFTGTRITVYARPRS